MLPAWRIASRRPDTEPVTAERRLRTRSPRRILVDT